MTRFVAMLSGKGGVGKTVLALNLGVALAGFGRDVIVVDANIRKPNIGIHLGSSVNPVSLHDALKGTHNIKETVFIHPSGLKIVPASISLKDMEEVDIAKIEHIVKDLDNVTELVILDGASGMHDETESVVKASDSIIIVTEPNMMAVTDALRTMRHAQKQGKEILGIVVNKIESDNTEVGTKNIEHILQAPVIGEIPYDRNFKQSLKAQHPLVYLHPHSKASLAIKKLAGVLIGEEYDVPLPTSGVSDKLKEAFKKW